MTRAITGTRTGLSGASTTGSRSGVKERMIKKIRGDEDDEPKTAKERYKKEFDKKMEEYQSAAKKAMAYSVKPPGTDWSEERELSDAAKEVLELMARKKAKKAARKKKHKVYKPVPKFYTGMQGGRIDGRGAIYGPDGRWIAQVCKKTGKVKSRTGRVICRYNPKSSYCEYQIIRFIEWEYRTNKGGVHTGAKGHAHALVGVFGHAGDLEGAMFDSDGDGIPDHGIYGGGSVHGGGGLYGSGGGGGGVHGGGGLWGSGGDDNSGGGSVWG
jgi:hypothetical protein